MFLRLFYLAAFNILRLSWATCAGTISKTNLVRNLLLLVLFKENAENYLCLVQSAQCSESIMQTSYRIDKYK
jgi:hypothetical protein